MSSKTYDYIIVGAGSSGCVLANRLSENPDNQVLLLEAGGKALNPWIHIPIGYFKTMHHPKLDWCFKTQQDPGLNHRSIAWPRGKVLGGCSAINGLLYIRGQAADYDNWVSLGNPGWSFDELLPYFKKSEDNERGADNFHGVGGELHVSNMRIQRALCARFIEAAEQVGIRRNHDFNGTQQEGAGDFQLTISRNGLRCSAASAFLKPAMRRKNLHVLTNAQVHQVKFSGQRATSISYAHTGTEKLAHCHGEIILAAGTLGSPHLLMLSGIGEQKELGQHGIKSINHRPGVGRNLQDHLQVRCIYKVNTPITLNDELRKPLRKLLMALEYALFRSGPLTMAASQVAIFTKSDACLDRPDIQFHLQPLSAAEPARGTHKFSAFTASVCQLRPTSRGHLKLKSADPADYPEIYPNYLATAEDQETVIKAIKVTRRIAGAAALKTLISEEFEPGYQAQSDAELLQFARNRGTTIYHPTGTCKMGPLTDRMSVVDHRLRVHGVAGLRVVDCSIMPEIISGNTNAAAIMIAEKAADMISQDASKGGR